MPNLPSLQPSNTTKRTPCSHKIKTNTENKMNFYIEIKGAVNE